MLSIIDAMTQRKAIRAYQDKPVPQHIIEEILDAARWAPSGVNSQPWQVCVVTGAIKDQLTERLINAREHELPSHPDYQYYPLHWVEPYRGRRIATGKALYEALGIEKSDKNRQKQAWADNYRFFGAPVGLFFLLDAGLEKGSWLDMGMFIQNVMLAARFHGLETCPQASLAEYPDIVREMLGLPDSLDLVCGMALGYADQTHPVNNYRLARVAVKDFTHWYG